MIRAQSLDRVSLLELDPKDVKLFKSWWPDFYAQFQTKVDLWQRGMDTINDVQNKREGLSPDSKEYQDLGHRLKGLETFPMDIWTCIQEFLVGKEPAAVEKANTFRDFVLLKLGYTPK